MTCEELIVMLERASAFVVFEVAIAVAAGALLAWLVGPSGK